MAEFNFDDFPAVARPSKVDLPARDSQEAIGILRNADDLVIIVTGSKVALGILQTGLIPHLERWLNDFMAASTYFQGDLRPGDRSDVEERYNRLVKECSFTVYETESDQPVGLVNLHNIDHYNRTAEFGIIIGTEWQGKGLGTEATRLTLDWAFHGLGLHNVMLTVFDYNRRGIGAYTRAGFREFGRRREAKRLAGREYDVVYMECLATEFEGSVLASLLPDGE